MLKDCLRVMSHLLLLHPKNAQNQMPGYRSSEKPQVLVPFQTPSLYAIFTPPPPDDFSQPHKSIVENGLCQTRMTRVRYPVPYHRSNLFN